MQLEFLLRPTLWLKLVDSNCALHCTRTLAYFRRIQFEKATPQYKLLYCSLLTILFKNRDHFCPWQWYGTIRINYAMQ